MRQRRAPLTLFACTLIASCAAKYERIATSSTDQLAANAALQQDGTATISGSALIRQRGGGVVTCAGNEVHLIPSTPSTVRELRRVFGGETGYVSRGGNVSFGGGTEVVPPQPNRTIVCDAQGFFRFSDVRPGRWHIITSVVWEVGERYQGGALLGTTEVQEGQEVEVTLTG